MGGAPMGWTLLYPNSTPPVFRSAEATAEFWHTNDGCKDTTTAGFAKDDVACKSNDGCKDSSEVTLCTVTGGLHTWPGGDPSALKGMAAGLMVSALIGKASTAMNASEEIWAFFEKHPLH